MANGVILGDENCSRIRALCESYLIKLCADSSGWDILFQDPYDKRYWELTYPDSGIHGGGAPVLQCITDEMAISKYNINE